jgi:hypothetical protein
VVVNGEGVQGLIAPLFQAGARSVLATQWEIGDQAAVRFIRTFYDHLAEGRAVGEALRLAKLDAIKANVPPHDWAAFMVIGDPLVSVPLQPPSWWRGPWLIAALVILTTAGALLYWLRMRSGRKEDAR